MVCWWMHCILLLQLLYHMLYFVCSSCFLCVLALLTLVWQLVCLLLHWGFGSLTFYSISTRFFQSLHILFPLLVIMLILLCAILVTVADVAEFDLYLVNSFTWSPTCSSGKPLLFPSTYQAGCFCSPVDTFDCNGLDCASC